MSYHGRVLSDDELRRRHARRSRMASELEFLDNYGQGSRPRPQEKKKDVLKSINNKGESSISRKATYSAHRTKLANAPVRRGVLYDYVIPIGEALWRNKYTIAACLGYAIFLAENLPVLKGKVNIRPLSTLTMPGNHSAHQIELKEQKLARAIAENQCANPNAEVLSQLRGISAAPEPLVSDQGNGTCPNPAAEVLSQLRGFCLALPPLASNQSNDTCANPAAKVLSTLEGVSRAQEVQAAPDAETAPDVQEESDTWVSAIWSFLHSYYTYRVTRPRRVRVFQESETGN